MSNEVNEVLDLAQRKKRAMITKKNKNKLKIARRVAQRKKAPKRIIKKRAYAQARKIIRRKIAGKLGADYANLSPTQKMNVDKMIAGKQKIIKKLALRLIPRIEQQEAKRLQSFLHGKQLENLGKKEMKEDLNEKFQGLIDGRQDERVKKATEKKNQFIKFFKKFSDVIAEDSPVYKALEKKAEKSGIAGYVLGEVYIRGMEAWKESFNVSREQYAFARVNSYINKGKTYFNEDKDLHEWEDNTLLEISQRVLKNYAMKAHGQAKNPGYNKEYHARIKKQYGSDDPEVKQYDKFEKKHQNRVKGMEKATKRLGGFDHQKEVESHVAKSKAMTDKYGHKLQNTPRGSGYVVGHDPNKEDHAIVRVDHATGVRSKNKQDLRDHSVHIKHLKEAEDINEWAKFDRFGKRITSITNPCGKGYKQKGVIVVDGKEVPHCVKVGAKGDVQEGKMKELDSDIRNMDNGNFRKKYKKDKKTIGDQLNFKEENIEEAREITPAFKRAQKNLADIKNGGVERKAREAAAKKAAKDASMAKAKEHKELADKHYRKYQYHHELHKDTESIRSDLERGDWKNHGFESKEHARGAEEELSHQSELERRRAEKHKDDHEHHAAMYKIHSGKAYKYTKPKSKKLSYSDFVKGRKKVNEEILGEMRLKPSDREIGTDSSVANYKEDTPGQGKDKTHDKCGTPDCCGKCSMKEETLDESWSKGASSSNFSDKRKSNEYKKKRDMHFKAAKRYETGSDKHNELMAKGHVADAKYIKHSYHAGLWGSSETAKKDYKKSMEAAKEYKTVKEGTIEGVPVVHTNAADVKNVKVTTPDGKVVWRKQRKARDLIK